MSIQHFFAIIILLCTGILGVSKAAYLSASTIINSLRFTLSCVTTGGPATDVTWIKNGNVMLSDQAQLQTITSYEDSTYLNEITLTDSIIAGEYRIDVSNAVSTVSSTFTASG